MMNLQKILKNRYKLQEKLSENMGRQTWIGIDLEAEPTRSVILKLLVFNPQMQWDELKLFEREASVLKNINHPKIPRYIDYFYLEKDENSGVPYFVLVQEAIAGESLKKMVENGKYFSERKASAIAKQVLKILTELHEVSPPILHRDIKPSNLIWGSDKSIYLVDFGAVQDKAKAEGATFTVVGTSGYAPPEQLWGKAVPASDLYALGATLIYLLTKVSPADLPQKRMQIQFKNRVTLTTEFADWIQMLIQPAPERRFTTARQALEALESIQYSSELTTQPQLKRSSPNYGCLSLFFLTVVGIPALVKWGPDFFELSPRRNTTKEWEFNNNVEAMNRAQQAYFIGNNTFSGSIENLGVGISNSKEYVYSTVPKESAAFNYAIAQKQNFKSFVGGVFVVLDSENKSKTIAILCKTDLPGKTTPPAPTLQEGKPVCAEGTTRVGE